MTALFMTAQRHSPDGRLVQRQMNSASTPRRVAGLSLDLVALEYEHLVATRTAHLPARAQFTNAVCSCMFFVLTLRALTASHVLGRPSAAARHMTTVSSGKVRAVRCAEGSTECEDALVPVLQIERPRDLLVRVKAVSVNPIGTPRVGWKARFRCR